MPTLRILRRCPGAINELSQLLLFVVSELSRIFNYSQEAIFPLLCHKLDCIRIVGIAAANCRRRFLWPSRKIYKRMLARENFRS